MPDYNGSYGSIYYMNFKRLFFLFLVGCMGFSCHKKQDGNPQPVTPSGSLTFQMKNLVGNTSFQFNAPYTNSSNDTFKVSSFQYLLSDFKLLTKDSNVVEIPNSYVYVDASVGNTFALTQVPYGDYIGISYLIGVDSVTNTLGAPSGPLDPITNMYWDWNGYIDLILTGTSPSSKGSGHIFDYHIGGFRYPYATQRIVSHSFGSTVLNVKEGANPQVFINIDLLEFFEHPIDLSIKDLSSVTVPGSNASTVATNYQDMFQFNQIQN